MRTLYQLIITDAELSYPGHSEDFAIGIFETQRQAKAVAQHYLQSIPGFCEYPCTYRIIPKQVKGCDCASIPDAVWMAQGWNTNEKFDEVDIVESDCLLSKEQAETECKVQQKLYRRTEWTISHWRIGHAEWTSGFQRESS